MTCYSARYLGDKIKTYREHEIYLLRKLIHKIERKYNSTRLGKLAPITSRGYVTSNAQRIAGTSWHGIWKYKGELYEEPYFPEVMDFKDCPYIYFDFRYYPNNSNSYEHVTPDIVLDTVKQASMVDDVIVVENLRYTSNATYFKVIIPISAYTNCEYFTYENKKIKNQFTPYSKEYKLILDFLITNYYDLFNRIYMVPNHEEQCMEYYLRYTGDWHFDYCNQIHDKILHELYDYCKDKNLEKTFLETTSIFITTELGGKK